jgi:hypothetical protein
MSDAYIFEKAEKVLRDLIADLDGVEPSDPVLKRKRLEILVHLQSALDRLTP